MHKLLVLSQSPGFQFFFQVILHGLYIVVCTPFDGLNLIGCRKVKILIEGAQTGNCHRIDGCQFRQRQGTQRLKIVNFNLDPVADERVLRKISSQRLYLVSVPTIDRRER